MSLVLASSSATRLDLLSSAGVPVEAVPARIDEEAIRTALEGEGAAPRDVADALAEAKARKVSSRRPDDLVLGCDQVLDHHGRVLSKFESIDAARAGLRALANDRHQLLSAIVAYEGMRPVWRHVGVARMEMREISDAYLDAYLARNWDSVCHCVGGYRLEREGIRLFRAVDGSYFDVLGLPLIPLLSWLTERGYLPV